MSSDRLPASPVAAEMWIRRHACLLDCLGLFLTPREAATAITTTRGALRQKAHDLGLPLGHRR